MFIRIKMRGTGTEDDPFRCPFPNYRMVTERDALGRCIIQIPDRDAPPETDAIGTPLYPILNGIPVLIGLRPAQKLAFLVRLRRLFDRIKDRIDADGIE